MSFWAEKIRQEMPAPLPPPTMHSVAPGRWWQGDQQQSVQTTSTVAQQPPSDEVIYVGERCPRCGSMDYAEFQIDASGGGMGGVTKRCFDCRYPSFNASGDVIRGKGVSVPASEMAYSNVRQQGNPKAGSWQGSATFDGATKIL